jgi:hypothetical protein
MPLAWTPLGSLVHVFLMRATPGLFTVRITPRLAMILARAGRVETTLTGAVMIREATTLQVNVRLTASSVPNSPRAIAARNRTVMRALAKSMTATPTCSSAMTTR